MYSPKLKKHSHIRLIKEVWEVFPRGIRPLDDRQKEVLVAIDFTLFVLEQLDVMKNENHKQYFINMFLSRSNNLNQIQISNKYGICCDTVGGYSDMYINIFERYLSLTKRILPLFACKKTEESIIKALTDRAVYTN